MESESFLDLIQKSPRSILRNQMASKDPIDTPLALRDARGQLSNTYEISTSTTKVKSDGLRKKLLRRQSIQAQDTSSLDSSILVGVVNKTYADVSLDSSSSSVNQSINIPHDTRFKNKRRGPLISASQPASLPSMSKSSKNDDISTTKRTLRSIKLSASSNPFNKESSLPHDQTYSTVNMSLMDSSNDSINLSAFVKNKKSRVKRTTVTLSQPNPTLKPIDNATNSALPQVAEDSYASLSAFNSTNESLQTSIVLKNSNLRNKRPKVTTKEFVQTQKISNEQKDARLTRLLASPLKHNSPRNKNKKNSPKPNIPCLSRSLQAESEIGSDSSFETSKIEIKRKFGRRTSSRAQIDLKSILNKAKQNACIKVSTIVEDSECASIDSSLQTNGNLHNTEFFENIKPLEYSDDELSDTSKILENEDLENSYTNSHLQETSKIKSILIQDANKIIKESENLETPGKSLSGKNISKQSIITASDEVMDLGTHLKSNDFQMSAETKYHTHGEELLLNIDSVEASSVENYASIPKTPNSNVEEITEMSDSEDEVALDKITVIPESQDSNGDGNTLDKITVLETQKSNGDKEITEMLDSEDGVVPDRNILISDSQKSDRNENIVDKISVPETQKSNEEITEMLDSEDEVSGKSTLIQETQSTNELNNTTAILEKDDLESFHINSNIQETSQIKSNLMHEVNELDDVEDPGKPLCNKNISKHSIINASEEVIDLINNSNSNNIKSTAESQDLTQENEFLSNLDSVESSEDLNSTFSKSNTNRTYSNKRISQNHCMDMSNQSLSASTKIKENVQKGSSVQNSENEEEIPKISNSEDKEFSDKITSIPESQNLDGDEDISDRINLIPETQSTNSDEAIPEILDSEGENSNTSGNELNESDKESNNDGMDAFDKLFLSSTNKTINDITSKSFHETNKTVNYNTSKSFHEATNKTVNDNTSKSFHTTTNKTFNDITSKSFHEATNKTVNGNTSKSFHKTNKTVNDNTSKSLHDTTNKAVNDNAFKSFHETNKTVNDITSKSFHDTTNKTVNDNTSKSFHEATNKTVNDNTSKSFHRTTNKTVNDITSKSFHDTTNKTVKDNTSESFHETHNMESQTLNKSSFIKESKSKSFDNEKSRVNFHESQSLNDTYINLSSQEFSHTASCKLHDVVPSDILPPPDFRNEEEKENTPGNRLDVSFSSVESEHDDDELQNQIADSIASLSDDSPINSPYQDLGKSHLTINSPLAEGGRVLDISPYKISVISTPSKNTKLDSMVLSSNKNISLSQFTTPERKRKSLAIEYDSRKKTDLVTPEKLTRKSISNRSRQSILSQTNVHISKQKENNVSKNLAENPTYSVNKNIAFTNTKDSSSNFQENVQGHFTPQSVLSSQVEVTPNTYNKQMRSNDMQRTTRQILASETLTNSTLSQSNSTVRNDIGKNYTHISDSQEGTPLTLRMDETDITDGTKKLNSSISSNARRTRQTLASETLTNTTLSQSNSTVHNDIGKNYTHISDSQEGTPLTLRMDETDITDGTKKLNSSISSNARRTRQTLASETLTNTTLSQSNSTVRNDIGKNYTHISDSQEGTPLNLRMDETDITVDTKKLNSSIFSNTISRTKKLSQNISMVVESSQQFQLRFNDTEDTDFISKVTDTSRNLNTSQLKVRSIRNSTRMSQSFEEGDNLAESSNNLKQNSTEDKPQGVKRKYDSKGLPELDYEPEVGMVVLSHQAAKHKLSLKPKRRYKSSRHRKQFQDYGENISEENVSAMISKTLQKEDVTSSDIHTSILRPQNNLDTHTNMSKPAYSVRDGGGASFVNELNSALQKHSQMQELRVDHDKSYTQDGNYYATGTIDDGKIGRDKFDAPDEIVNTTDTIDDGQFGSDCRDPSSSLSIFPSANLDANCMALEGKQQGVKQKTFGRKSINYTNPVNIPLGKTNNIKNSTNERKSQNSIVIKSNESSSASTNITKNTLTMPNDDEVINEVNNPTYKNNSSENSNPSQRLSLSSFDNDSESVKNISNDDDKTSEDENVEEMDAYAQNTDAKQAESSIQIKNSSKENTNISKQMHTSRSLSNVMKDNVFETGLIFESETSLAQRKSAESVRRKTVDGEAQEVEAEDEADWEPFVDSEDSDSDVSTGAHNILNHSQQSINENIVSPKSKSELCAKNISLEKRESVKRDNVVPINAKQMTMRDFLYNLSKRPMKMTYSDTKRTEKRSKLVEQIIQSFQSKGKSVVKKPTKTSKVTRKQKGEPTTYPSAMIKEIFTHYSKLPVHKDALPTVIDASEQLWSNVTKHMLILLTQDGK
ncbi:unnamed protein product, partial [Meganyctiphanes norvegica]